jgi:hypothetical protein
MINVYNGVKICQIANVKYATTMKAAWNFEFLSVNDKTISIETENGGWNFMKIAQVGLFSQYSVKLTRNSIADIFEKTSGFIKKNETAGSTSVLKKPVPSPLAVTLQFHNVIFEP